jgi:DNA/RNA-binding domain of Phe-tRNA-synthetase-like protein
MMKIIVSDRIIEACPKFTGAAVLADVQNSDYNEALWREIDAFADVCRNLYTTEDIKTIPSIAATRAVYKALGKDPSRYRPSGEQLMRRVLQGKELYKIDTLVDLINLASMKYGYSIGGFDADRIQGDVITLGVGEKDEPYEGIGRGMLNIEGLPVYRDKLGGIGTPTSDNERTKMRPETVKILAVINGYDGDLQHVAENAAYIQQLLRLYGYSNGGDVILF